MLLRRVFFYWQFAAAVVLPAWLVIGWPIFGAGGWAVLGVFFGAVLLGFWLLAVSLLIYARREVRATRAVSWPDVGALAVWHALIIAVGFYAEVAPLLSIILILVGAGVSWLAGWELYTAARRRVREVMVEIELAAQAADPSRPQVPGRPTSGSRAYQDPSVIVISEKQASDPTMNRAQNPAND
ncbi:MAG TPA: MFS transporter permease [Glaciibacter sp.]|nr:MFS transporter permease [Glaciibacter sp.]